jgi:hypothetical protein
MRARPIAITISAATKPDITTAKIQNDMHNIPLFRPM